MLLFATSDHCIFPFVDRGFISTPPRERLWRHVKAYYSMKVSHKGSSMNDPGSVKFKKTVLKGMWPCERFPCFFHIPGFEFWFFDQ